MSRATYPTNTYIKSYLNNRSTMNVPKTQITKLNNARDPMFDFVDAS